MPSIRSVVQGVRAPRDILRLLSLSLLAAVIGIAAGIAAWLLYSLIALCANLVYFHRVAWILPNITSNPLGLWVLIVPAAGGLIVGLMAKYGTDKIRGHGIPEAMEAILFNRSRIAPRVAILKPLSAAIAIGTGGPFGAEGPIIQTGGALGSLLGQLVSLTTSERKVLLGCGAAAGMAATFSTPIAGVIFAIELMLFEFRSRSFIPLVIATTIATAIHYWLIGPGPMFTVSDARFDIVRGLPFYLLLGLICGLAAVIISKSLYWIEDQFERLPFDRLWWPALGAIGLGIIGYFVPRVLSVGYNTISDILNNQLGLGLLLLILVFKTLALLVSLGSGTSGGLLAPMFMGGAALGGAFAIVANHLVPGAHLDPSAFALVGMAAVFAAASRATFTFIIFAFEITRNYNAVLPLMLVCVIANAIGLLYLKESIMTEKLARRGLKIHLEYEVDVLHQVTVGDVMDRAPVTLASELSLEALTDRLNCNDPELARHNGFLLLNGDGKLEGLLTRGDVFRALAAGTPGYISLLNVGHRNPVVAYPGDTLSIAVNKMLHYGFGRLPIVDPKCPDKVIGYLGRSAVLDAWQRRINEESQVETGWLFKGSKMPSSS